MLLGVTGAFLTGDIFNLYVWFESMLISSFGLLASGGKKAQFDAGVKYVTLNLVATTFFLMTVGFLYGLTGTLNMADLARTLPTVGNQGLVTTLAILFLVTFGAKAAVFPMFYWLPAAYHTASAPVVAIFAALLTKVGVYAINRVPADLADYSCVQLRGPCRANDKLRSLPLHPPATDCPRRHGAATSGSRPCPRCRTRAGACPA